VIVPLAERFRPSPATFEIKLWLLILLLSSFAGVAVLAARRRQPRARMCMAVELIVISGIWLRVSRPVEGTVLKTLSQNHGITVADMIALPCLALAAGLLWVARREHRAETTPAAAAPPVDADVPPRLSAAETREH
jgi:hypothetical protein